MDDNRDVTERYINIWEPAAIDALTMFDDSIVGLVAQDSELIGVEIISYWRVPIREGSNQTKIRIDLSRNKRKAFFFYPEEFFENFRQHDHLRRQLLEDALRRIKRVNWI